MSNATIIPIIKPMMAALVLPILARKAVSASRSSLIGSPITRIIRAPVIKTLSNGTIRMGFSPAIALGRLIYFAITKVT